MSLTKKTPNPRRSGKRQSVKAFANFVFKRTKLEKPFTQAILACLPQFISESLAAGYKAYLPQLGTFSIKKRKGRTTKGKMWGKTYTRVHPEAYYPKFKSSATFKKTILKLTKGNP